MTASYNTREKKGIFLLFADLCRMGLSVDISKRSMTYQDPLKNIQEKNYTYIKKKKTIFRDI